MENCLVTKLKGVVDNPNLLKLGEFKVVFKAGYSESDAGYMTFNERSSTIGTARIISGTGHFGTTGDAQEVTVNSNLDYGYSFNFHAETDCVVAFPGKYKVTGMRNGYSNHNKLWIAAEELEYIAPNITDVFGLHVNGAFDISKFNANAKLGYVNTYLSGDCYGDVSPYLPNIYNINANIFYYNPNLTGDISLITADFAYMRFTDSDTIMSWKNTRDSSLKVMATSGTLRLGNDVDAMLINQAQCQVGENRPSDQFTIKVAGTRTSASDAAVTTLKGKGFTVIVNGVTL